MLSLGLFWLAFMAGPDSAPPPAAVSAAQPAIRLTLNNNRQFREGEKAKIQVETANDGYLLVLNYDTDGRLRILFPVSPGDDNFVQGGRRYEVRDRGDRDESFIAGREGEGVVYAAVSEDPIRFDDLAAGDNWDYDRVSLGSDSKDPEAEITDLVQGLVSERGFDYDVLSYRVYGYAEGSSIVTTAWYPRPYGYWDDYYCDYWYRPSLFGCRYYPPGISIGLYSSYYPFGYGFGYGFGGFYFPFYRNRFVYGSHRNWPVVVGRPRGYTIVRRPFVNNGGGRRTGSWASPGRGDDHGRVGDGRGRGRPSDGARAGRPSGDRPARPSGGDHPGRPRSRPPAGSNLDNINWERDRNGTPRPPIVTEGRARRVEIADGNRTELARPARPHIESRPRSERSVEVPARRAGGNDGPRIERSRPAVEMPRVERSRPAVTAPRIDRSRGPDRPRSVERPRSSPPPVRAARPQPAPRVQARPQSAPRVHAPRGGGGSHGGRPRGRP